MRTTAKYAWLFTLLPVFVIWLVPLHIHEADAGFEGLVGSNTAKSKEVYYLSGDLTAPKDDKPFGGHVVGNYLITVNFDEVKITSKLEEKSHDKMFEGWLVDLDTGTNFSVGQFDKQSAKLFFYHENMESRTYDWFVVVEESMAETDSADLHTMGGAQVDVEFFSREPNRGE